MIDCHWAVELDPRATRAERDQYVEWMRSEAEALGVDRLCLLTRAGRRGDTVEECRANNELLATLVDEHPEFLHAWCRVNPAWEEAAVAEFRRAVEEGGLLGLKYGWDVNCSDPRVDPIAEAAVEMDVPIKVHAAQRTHGRDARWPEESFSDDVVELAQRHPELKLLESHISAPGDWEYRIKNIEDVENVFLDVSGSGCERGMLETAAERLGVDRLVYGSDNAHVPCVGKLAGCDLAPEAKAEIAYKMNDLFADDDPRKLSEADVAERRDRLADCFREADPTPPDATVVDANSFVGHWPFRDLDASATAVLDLMDEKGVDRALVSSVESAMYRNPHGGNRRLVDDVEGHEDRLLPVATVNPTYAGWRKDMDECLTDFGMYGVKLLPAYHGYDLDQPEVEALAAECVDRDVPVFLAGPLEDQRQRHPQFDLHGVFNYRFDAEQMENAAALLRAVPDADVVVADAWVHGFDLVDDLYESEETWEGTWNRPGATLFVADDLPMWRVSQGERIVEEIGPGRLVCSAQLPFAYFESNHNRVDHLPVTDGERDAIRGGTLASLLDL